MKVYERYKLKDSFGLISGKDLEFIDDSNLLSAVNNELYNFNIKNHNFKKQAFKKEISCFTQILSEPVGESFDSGNGTAKGCVSVSREIAGDVAFQSFEEVGVVCIENEIHYKDSIFNGHRKPITRLLLTAELLFSADSSGLVIVWDLLQQRGIYKLKTTSGAPIFTMIYLRDFLLIADKSTILIWDFKNELIIESLNFTAEINSVLLIENNTAIEGDQIVHLLVSSENQIQLLELNTTKLFQKANFPTLSNTLEASLNPTVTEFESVESGVLLPKTIQVLSKAGTLLSSKYRIRQMKQIQNLLFVQLENQLTLYKLKCPRKTKKQPISLSQCNEIKTEKIRNFTLFQSKKNPTLIKIGISLKSNQIEIFNLDKNDLKLPQTPKSILNTSHQKEIRNLTLTKNNNQVLSISEGEIKLWDLQTLKLLNNFGTEEIPTFAVFMPGDEYFIVSTKSGSLNIYELSSCNLIESIKAHTGPIWSIAIIDKKGLVSGGEDGNVLLFDFDMILDHDYSKIRKRPTLVHTRTLKMNENILCLKVSPCSKLLCVSLLDMTVKVFYLDTLKFALSLYGHKLPVLTMDISSGTLKLIQDSKLLITGSSDKSIKVWGLKFGDLQKSLLKHQDSVLKVQFVWGTYCFFSTSKDATIMYWDGETNENLDVLKGHFGKVGALSVGQYGNFIVTGSSDRSIKVWEKTTKQYVVQEQRELELEQEYENQTLHSINEEEDKLISKPTLESMKDVELLSEALELYNQEKSELLDYNQISGKQLPLRNVFWHRFDIDTTNILSPTSCECVLKVLKSIKQSHLQDTLISLTFKNIKILLHVLYSLLEQGCKDALIFKTVLEIMKIFGDEIASDQSLLSNLQHIQQLQRIALNEEKAEIGYNIAALEYLKTQKVVECDFGQEEPVAKAPKRKRVVVVS